jgi:hypothetical protein
MAQQNINLPMKQQVQAVPQAQVLPPAKPTPVASRFDLTQRQTNALLEVVKGTVYLNQRATRADIEALLLGRKGFTCKTIGARVGLSAGQVSYRLKLAGISTLLYRNGISPLAQQEMAMARQESAQYYATIQSKVKRYLKDQKQWQSSTTAQQTGKTGNASTTA